MTVAAVAELSEELHRLAVAGVGLATGDRRVAALLPVLDKSGEKVPVFARIAERTRALLEASKVDVSDDFLQLNTLVGAVLKTQDETGVDGELAPLPPAAAVDREIPARAIAELRDGLYAGSRDVLEHAIERGWFGDARLVSIALGALQSDSAEIANLAATTLLPPYGRGIVPPLVASLDLSLKRPAARIVATVQRADAESGAALARQILDPAAERVFTLPAGDGPPSDEAIVAALGCLGDSPADRGLLVDHLSAKRKALRVAALARLLALGDADAEVRAAEMLGGSAAKSREAIEAVHASSSAPAALVELLESEAHELAASLTSAKPEPAKLIDAARIVTSLIRVELNDSRFEAVLALMKRAEAHPRMLDGFGLDGLRDALGWLMEACPPKRHDELMSMVVRAVPDLAVAVAVERLGPERALNILRGVPDKALATALEHAFPSERGPCSRVARGLPPPSAWTSDWLELGIDRKVSGLVEYLWSLDPSAVVAYVLQRPLDEWEDVLVGLIADPGRAAEMRRQLDREMFHESVSIDDLCRAIETGDRDTALACLDGLPYYLGVERLATLRARLIEHFERASS